MMEGHETSSNSRTNNAIAVVGMACRFPGDAADIESFWEMLRNGTDAWSEIPGDRFNAKGWYHPNPNRPGSASLSQYLRASCFVLPDVTDIWTNLYISTMSSFTSVVPIS